MAELVKQHEKVSSKDHIRSLCFLIWRGGLKLKRYNFPQLKWKRKRKHRLWMFNTNLWFHKFCFWRALFSSEYRQMNTEYKGTSCPSWQWAHLKTVVIGTRVWRKVQWAHMYRIKRAKRFVCIAQCLVGFWATVVYDGDFDSKERN